MKPALRDLPLRAFPSVRACLMCSSSLVAFTWSLPGAQPTQRPYLKEVSRDISGLRARAPWSELPLLHCRKKCKKYCLAMCFVIKTTFRTKRISFGFALRQLRKLANTPSARAFLVVVCKQHHVFSKVCSLSEDNEEQIRERSLGPKPEKTKSKQNKTLRKMVLPRVLFLRFLEFVWLAEQNPTGKERKKERSCESGTRFHERREVARLKSFHAMVGPKMPDLIAPVAPTVNCVVCLAAPRCASEVPICFCQSRTGATELCRCPLPRIARHEFPAVSRPGGPSQAQPGFLSLKKLKEVGQDHRHLCNWGPLAQGVSGLGRGLPPVLRLAEGAVVLASRCEDGLALHRTQILRLRLLACTHRVVHGKNEGREGKFYSNKNRHVCQGQHLQGAKTSAHLRLHSSLFGNCQRQ